ncbi:MAG TPA: hypothetical protein VGL93_19965 [Streptosporangiaceae bacterium]|jgi:hypothetical protein
MSVRMTKPWTDLTDENVARLPGQTGVYEIAGASDEVVATGYAGGRSRFGLRSELADRLTELGAGHRFRYEVTVQYLSRYSELVGIAAGRIRPA